MGLGYVGLVTSACLAEWGHQVIGVETNDSRLDALKQGRVPFFEPGLSAMVSRHATSGDLAFSASGPEAAAEADVVIVAVGTHDGNGGWQTETMLACLSEVVPHMSDAAVLVVRSTLPPDFIRQLPRLLRSLREQAGLEPIAAIVNPEFTREGAALADFLEAERVIFGLIDDPDGHGEGRLRDLYERSAAPILVMSAIDAAFAKLGSNLFLATKISFANELATLCDAYGAQVDQVVAGMAYDARIGGRFLRAGVGFGGSCLPNQVTMTVKSATLAGIPSPLLAAVDEINHRQRTDFVARIREMIGGSLAGKRVALLGLTFKPETDDLRDAPALEIAAHLIEGGATVVAYDPMETARRRSAELVPGLNVVTSALEAVDGVDAIGLVTEWKELVQLDWSAIRGLVRTPVLVDGRGALSPEAMAAAGFDYAAFGRGVREGEVARDVAAPAAKRRRSRRTAGADANQESMQLLRVE
ncbi:MAG: UDP-glucose/GDP-mannose dehydrogenase family protein [Candidatus Limnocylindria bacterium]